MAFEEYQHGGQLPSSVVRITKGMQLRIGAAVIRQYTCTRPNRIALYFDRETNKVGLRLLHNEDKGERPFSYALSSSRDDWHCHSAIFGFVKHHKIKIPVTINSPEIKTVNGMKLIIIPVEVEVEHGN